MVGFGGGLGVEDPGLTLGATLEGCVSIAALEALEPAEVKSRRPNIYTHTGARAPHEGACESLGCSLTSRRTI